MTGGTSCPPSTSHSPSRQVHLRPAINISHPLTASPPPARHQPLTPPHGESTSGPPSTSHTPSRQVHLRPAINISHPPHGESTSGPPSTSHTPSRRVHLRGAAPYTIHPIPYSGSYMHPCKPTTYTSYTPNTRHPGLYAPMRANIPHTIHPIPDIGSYMHPPRAGGPHIMRQPQAACAWGTQPPTTHPTSERSLMPASLRDIIAPFRLLEILTLQSQPS